MVMIIFRRRACVSISMHLYQFISRRCRSKLTTVTKPKVKLLEDLVKIRNIGIIAHIDAGKTTTTERMLYYSGYSPAMGEVHDGDTVMDYMEQERARGITITSAAITFNWLDHQINLIDTPGHVDFTVEVERALRVLDGAVAILDASAGVEAQTVTVWTQASRYNVPRVVYLNKMDKPKANVKLCLQGLKNKLNSVPLCLHVPIFTNGKFEGVIDLISMELIKWYGDTDGSEFTKQELKPEKGQLYELAITEREKLVETIADLDNEIAELLINSENVSNMPAALLKPALRRLTLQESVVPVLCGSSYRNVGVQLLLDAVVSYLPSPDERQHLFKSYYGNNLCAMAFKIAHDKTRGPLTFVRLYSGTLKEGQNIYNVNQDQKDKIGKIMLAFADDLKNVDSVSEGQIAVVSGLDSVVTGDTLVAGKSSAEAAQKQLRKENNQTNAGAILAGIQVADPVFFCSIEAPSHGTQVALDKALACLQREDPTLKVSVNPDSGQNIIAGMGELHIDIVRDRILKEHGVDAYLGPLQISYRETIVRPAQHTNVLNKTLGGVKNYVEITLAADLATHTPKDIKVVVTQENELGKIRSDHMKAIKNGVDLAFAHGPLLACPVINVELSLLAFKATYRTSPAMISAATSQCVNQLLRMCSVVLLEPVMKLEIVCEEKYVSKVLEDLQRRRSELVNVEYRQDVRVVLAKTPLSELRKYSNILRTFTSGTAAFSMEFDSYAGMDHNQQNKAIEEVTGFAPV